MDFLLITIGSHGDVHPFVGLGRALRERGHAVRLATNEQFGPLVRRAGLEFLPLGDAASFQAVQNDPDIWHKLRGPVLVMRQMADTLGEVYDFTAEHATADTVVVGSTLTIGARVASEKLGFPMASVHLSPLCIRSSHTMPRLPGMPDMNRLPRFLRSRFWAGADRFFIDPLVLPSLNAFRAKLGLGAVSRVQAGWWHSPHLTLALWPEWFFPHQPDYPEQVRLAGFPWYDEADQVPLDDDLAAWLDDGEAPVAFTPGSAMLFGERFFKTAVAACERLGRRGLLLTRHTDHLPAGLPASVRHAAFVPFGTLLPRCAALVHHGGIGTTSQALRAGVPQLVMAMSHDQFDNAAICRTLGVAEAITVRRFTPRRVAAAIGRLVSSPEVRAATRRVAAVAAKDRPLEAACVALEGLGFGLTLAG